MTKAELEECIENLEEFSCDFLLSIFAQKKKKVRIQNAPEPNPVLPSLRMPAKLPSSLSPVFISAFFLFFFLTDVDAGLPSELEGTDSAGFGWSIFTSRSEPRIETWFDDTNLRYINVDNLTNLKVTKSSPEVRTFFFELTSMVLPEIIG